MAMEWKHTNPADINKMFRIRRTCLEMIADRGFEVSVDDMKMKDDIRQFKTYLQQFARKEEPDLSDIDAEQRIYRYSLTIEARRAERRRADWEWKKGKMKGGDETGKVWINRHDLTYYTKEQWLKARSEGGNEWTEHEWDAAERRRGPDGTDNKPRYYSKQQWEEKSDPTWPDWNDAPGEYVEESKQCIMVFFIGANNKLTESDIKTYYQMMQDKGSDRCILVSPVHPTPQCRAAINTCEAAESEVSRKYFEIFLESELVINVMKHELVPRHEPLKPQEKRELIEALKIKENQLPRLQQADPAARHYGLRRGDVVRITRPSETSGLYITYRLVQL